MSEGSVYPATPSIFVDGATHYFHRQPATVPHGSVATTPSAAPAAAAEAVSTETTSTETVSTETTSTETVSTETVSTETVSTETTSTETTSAETVSTEKTSAEKTSAADEAAPCVDDEVARINDAAAESKAKPKGKSRRGKKKSATADDTVVVA